MDVNKRRRNLDQSMIIVLQTIKKRMSRDYVWRAGDPCISCHLISQMIEASDLLEMERLDQDISMMSSCKSMTNFKD